MKAPQRYDLLRLQLIRLVQAMEQHRDLAGEMSGDPSRRRPGLGSAEPLTLRVLPTIEGSRRHVRIRDRLPLLYSESPEIAAQTASGASRTKSRLAFPAWIREIASQKGQRVNPMQAMEMRIHLQKFEEELIYFIAFRKEVPHRSEALPTREIEISGSGLSFPTEISHDPGEDILIVYFPPSAPFPPLQLISEVVRPSRHNPRGGYQTPVKIVDISPQDRRRITDYIASRQRQKSLVKAYDLRS
jgi:hypothetical protein